MSYRLVQMFMYANLNDFSNIVTAITTGFKFDTIVFTYLFSVLYFISLPLIFLNRGAYLSFFNKTARIYSIVLLLLVIILLTIDYYYYRFFNNHFDSMFFGIIEDDTSAVLKSVWTDYPLIPVIIFFIATFFGLKYIVRKLFEKEYQFPARNIFLRILFVLMFTGLLGLGMRGSLGTFPIGKDDMIVCDDNSINELTPNAIFYLKEAIVDRKKFSISADVKLSKEKYKFKSTKEALSVYLESETDETENGFYKTTPASDFLGENPPNVILIVMESLSNHFLSFHAESFNLLGELEEQLPHCLLFRNFVPASNGTIGSFESLVANTPISPLSQSQFKHLSLPSANALPYFKANYNTSFVTSSKLGWRNLGIWASKQYFHDVEGRAVLLKEVIDADECTWGVYDEFLFQRIIDKLKFNTDDNKQSFIFGFTTTNHTPYELPDNYKPFSLEISDSLRMLLRVSDDMALKSFRNYQYCNHYLGKFIKYIRESGFGENTIIAVTGDHNVRNLFEYSDKDLLMKYSVPLLMYIPEKYLANTHIETSRFGSHKDIFPTLYNLSLSNTKYLFTGNNLLSVDTNTHYYGINSYTYGFDRFGATSLNSNVRYEWTGSNKQLRVTDNTQKLDALYNKIRSHGYCLDYFIRSSVSNLK